jgi:radical SAM superfamily enzyme
MGNEYRSKPYDLLSKDEYIDVAIEFLEHLNPDIVVQRIFASAPEELTLSEHWPMPTSELNKELVKKMETRNCYQGRLLQ